MRIYSPTTRSGLPEAHRRLQFRNRYLMMVKNDTWADVRRDLHRIAFYELLAFGHALLRERHLLRAYGDGAARAAGDAPPPPRRAGPAHARRAAAVRAARAALSAAGAQPSCSVGRISSSCDRPGRRASGDGGPHS